MIKIYENGNMKEEIDDNNVDWLPNANDGGAWIGSEKLLGWGSTSENIRVPIATDGNETYGSYDNPSNFQENNDEEDDEEDDSFKDVRYFQVGKDWNEVRANEGHDGFDLSQKEIDEFKEEYESGVLVYWNTNDGKTYEDGHVIEW